MSILKLTSDTLVGTPATGNIEYNGQFFGTDSNNSRAQMQRLVLETSKTASGTSVDFTGIPAWVKRITVMFQGISTNGTSSIQIQIGAGSITSTGYASSASLNSVNTQSSTGSIVTSQTAAASVYNGSAVITLLNASSYIWTFFSGVGSAAGTVGAHIGGGAVTLSGVLDRVRITTVNGTDTFDAGTINILYEG